MFEKFRGKTKPYNVFGRLFTLRKGSLLILQSIFDGGGAYVDVWFIILSRMQKKRVGNASKAKEDLPKAVNQTLLSLSIP